MRNSRRTPSETTPLLRSNETLEEVAPVPIDSSSAAGTESPIQDEDGNRMPVDADGGFVERQAALEDRSKQYEGMPEVRKLMKYIFPAIAIGVFLAAADGTIVVTSYGKIGSELHALNKTSWIANAYFLTLCAFQPLYGKLSEIFGRKACLLFAYLVFGLGCLFCGLSANMNQLILSRALAGVGGGGMTTVVSILLSDVIPLKSRGTWQGFINIIYASGAAAGAPLGGIIADYISWRWAFLAQAPLCLVAFIAVWFVLRLPKPDQSHWKTKLGRIDFLGAFILLGAVAALLVGLDRGSNNSWNDKITIACVSVSLPLFLVFVLVEIYVASEPFAPGHIIFERSLVAAFLCNFFSFSGWLAAIFYIPLYFQAVYGMSATHASLLLIPNIIAGVSGSLFGGYYMQRTGHYYWLTVLCYTFLVVGMIIVVLFSGPVASSVPGMVVGMMICGFSNGIGVTSSLIGLIANAGYSDQAVATACSYLFRSLGSVFGVSISATVVNQTLRSSLRQALRDNSDADTIAEKVRQSLEYIKTLEPATRDIVRECYAKSTRLAFSGQVILVLGAAVSAWWIREKKLS